MSSDIRSMYRNLMGYGVKVIVRGENTLVSDLISSFGMDGSYGFVIQYAVNRE